MIKLKTRKLNINNNNSFIAIVSSLVILIGIALLSYNYILSKKVIAYDYMANIFYTSTENKNEESIDQEKNIVENVENISQSEVKEEVKKSYTFQYIGYLEIPKINLKKGFVDKNSKDNDVEKNIYIAENASYPDVDKGNFIIAAHSGTGWKAFFNNLYKLSNGDQVVVTYNNKKYTYNIVNIYKQSKTGKITIYRNYDKTTLTLVTCTNNDDKTQTVYIAELVNIS